jgi:hypothetical protein
VISEAPKERRSRGVWVVFEVLASSCVDFISGCSSIAVYIV